MKTRHFFLGLASLLALSGPSWAAGGVGADSAGPGSKFQMALTIYAGGITLGKMDIDATVRGTDYHAVSNLETSGVVNAFWQAEIQATSSGKMGANIIEVAHNRLALDVPAKGAEFDIMIETRDAKHTQEIIDALSAAGYPPRTV